MSREIIISDNGMVTIPNEVKMNIVEIADLCGVSYQTAKRYVRDIEKLAVASGEHTKCGTVEGLKIYPDYYGLEMVIAVAFRVHSHKAKIFRQWVLRKITTNFQPLPPTLFIRLTNKVLSN